MQDEKEVHKNAASQLYELTKSASIPLSVKLPYKSEWEDAKSRLEAQARRPVLQGY